ncbi:hypothetical protein [Trichormus sp. NMC-1]|jgi:hypothetical protein|nr:hypothetical protein [Trichormus sp. NMC-1]
MYKSQIKIGLKIVGWVERSETQQNDENVGFRSINTTYIII